MSSTFAQVVGSLKTRAAAQIDMFPARVYWDKDAKPTDLDPNEPFLFMLIETDPADYVSFGGGRGNNIKRVDGELQGFVFLPKAWTLEEHARYGAHVADAFNAFADEHVSCGAAEPQPAVDGSSLMPPGLESEVTNWDCTVVVVPFKYDRIG